MELRTIQQVIILFLFLLSLLVDETKAEAVHRPQLLQVEEIFRLGQPNDMFQPSEFAGGNWSDWVTRKMEAQMPNFTVGTHHYQKSKYTARNTSFLGTPKELIGERERRFLHRNKGNHKREDYFLEKRGSHEKLKIIKHLDYSLLFLFVGISIILGLVLVPVAVSVRDNEQLQRQSTQQDINIPSSSPACMTTSKFYVSGVISSAMALIVFLIHLCMQKL